MLARSQNAELKPRVSMVLQHKCPVPSQKKNTTFVTRKMEASSLVTVSSGRSLLQDAALWIDLGRSFCVLNPYCLLVKRVALVKRWHFDNFEKQWQNVKTVNISSTSSSHDGVTSSLLVLSKM